MVIDEFIKRYGIGLTGGVASGKSTIASILRRMGKVVFDADQLSREVVSSGSSALAQIVDVFGGKVLKQDGSLDRSAMRSLVFNSPEKRRQLEGIIHPAVHDRLVQRIREKGLEELKDFWFYEASLIFENARQQKFKEVWVAYCEPETQIKRLMARDGIERELALKIIESQMPARKKRELADFVIETKGSIESVEMKVKNALMELSSR